jgi:hypothetical protein
LEAPIIHVSTDATMAWCSGRSRTLRTRSARSISSTPASQPTTR